MNYIVHYQDQGPNGPCGQSCNVTNPWSILMIFDDHDKLRAFADNLHKIGRRKPTLTWINRVEVHKDGQVHHFEDNLPLDL